jgi:hypothetical protein
LSTELKHPNLSGATTHRYLALFTAFFHTRLEPLHSSHTLLSKVHIVYWISVGVYQVSNVTNVENPICLSLSVAHLKYSVSTEYSLVYVRGQLAVCLDMVSTTDHLV